MTGEFLLTGLFLPFYPLFGAKLALPATFFEKI